MIYYMRVFGKDLPTYQDYLLRKHQTSLQCTYDYAEYMRSKHGPPIVKPAPITVYEGLYSVRACYEVCNEMYPYGKILYHTDNK